MHETKFHTVKHQKHIQLYTHKTICTTPWSDTNDGMSHLE